MKKSILGTILVVIVLGLVIYLFISNMGNIFNSIKSWSASPTGGKVSSAVESSLENLRKLYQSFEKTMDIMLNPEKAIYYEESKPSEEVVHYSYGISLESLDVPSLAIYSNGAVMGYPVLFSFKYSVPLDKNLNVNFLCDYEVSYSKKCFLGFVEEEEILSLNIFGSGSRILVCNIPTMNINVSNKSCSSIVNTGFYMDVKLLTSIKNIETKSVYRFLTINEKILVEALSRDVNVYKYLGLEAEKYDKAYYTGLLDFPKINIVRVGKTYGYPIVIFDSYSYDVIGLSLRPINNIEKIKEISVNIDYPNSVNILYLDPSSGECKNSLNFNFGYYNLMCSGKKCSVTINDEISFKNYKKRYFDRGIFVYIPLCVSNNIEKSSFDYADVLVTANAVYDYVLTESTRVYYYPLSE